MNTESRTFYVADWFADEASIPDDYDAHVAKAFRRAEVAHGIKLGEHRRDEAEECAMLAHRTGRVPDICRAYSADVLEKAIA